MPAAGTANETPAPRGVVLAGGNSRRFGQANKALARVDGRSLVSRATGAIRSVSDAPPIVAVQSDEQQETLATVIDRPVEYVRDLKEFDGPLAGLLAAARTAQAPRLAVVGCDMPLVAGEALRWLTGRSSTADAIVPIDSEGLVQPVHAIYRTRALENCSVRDQPLRAVLAELDVHRVPVATAPESVPLSLSVTNVNTRADLAAVRRRCEPELQRRAETG